MKYFIKGVSLISLIVTILIITILAAVIIPSGVDKINNAKITSFNENILTLKQEVNTYLAQNDEYPVKLDSNGSPVIYSITSNPALVAEATKKNDQNDIFYVIDLDKVKIDNKDNGVGKSIDDFYILAKTSGNVYYAKGTKIGNITYYTKQNKGDGVIAAVPTTAPVPSGAFDGTVNSPKLSAGMTAVKWNGSAWVNADNTNLNNDWYDYTPGVNKWANAKLVDNSMLVWIPRYTYQIVSGEHTSTTGNIDIKFSVGTNDTTTGGYRAHPAFYLGGWNIQASAPMIKQTGGTELTGIWVGKFESSNNGSSKIKIVDNVTSWRNINVNDIFVKCQAMNLDNATYGLTSATDTHMLKDSEWGAIVYLSDFALRQTKVSINASSSFITAGGNIVTNKSQSTTGTEYGIYDMSGSAYEYVAAYLANGNGNLTTNGSALYTADTKYKEAFPVGTSDALDKNYTAASQAYGHAIYETSSQSGSSSGWFGDYGCFPYNTAPFLLRGGAYTNAINGGIFYFNGNDGAAANGLSFRICLAVL